jgi:hypothetical protein
MFVGALLASSPLLPAAAQGADVQDTLALPTAGEPAAAEYTAAEMDAPAARQEKRAARRARSESRSSDGRGGEKVAAKARVRAERPPRKKSAYDLLRDAWHAPAPDELCAQARRAPIRDLVFRIDGKDGEEDTFVLHPESALGGFDEAQLEVARHGFGSWENGPTPHPRVLDLVYAAMLHFDVPYVHLISGIRKDRGGSRHSHGLAADVVLPGVGDEELAAFFRAQGFVGVGTYPHSGFVHVDTRDQSYFWIDRSSPGRRGKVVGVRAEEAKTVDEAALVRGNTGFINPPRLQRALNVRATKRRRAKDSKREVQQQPQIASGQTQTSEMTAH